MSFESLLTRSQTCPALLNKHGRSTSPSPTLFPPHEDKEQSVKWLNLLTSKQTLSFLLLFYALVFLILPFSSGKNSTISTEEYAVDRLNGQLPSPRSLLGNRKLILDKQALYSLQRVAPPHPWVEYRESGTVIQLSDALNSSLWQEASLYRTNESDVSTPIEAQRMVNGDTSASWCPKGDIRLFIGIMSRCCVAEAQLKRNAIRETWLQNASKHPDIEVRFILSQPMDDVQSNKAASFLPSEISTHGDMLFVPGLESYHNLPEKTLRFMKYALSSPCNYTHILKTDDDVFLRPEKLLSIIERGQYDFEIPIHASESSNALFDGIVAGSRDTPWMTGMYVGQLDSNKSGMYPGWEPIRDPRSKWYLSDDELSPNDASELIGTRWVSGWGYLFSRDVAEWVDGTASHYASLPASKAPVWWGKMPWEDTLVAALLAQGPHKNAYHHRGFKSAWDACDEKTVLKHLDWDAPSLLKGLQAQEESGLWQRKTIVCSSGDFTPGNYSDWQSWRNNLPDNQATGFM